MTEEVFYYCFSFWREVSKDLSIHYSFNRDSEAYFFADQISMADRAAVLLVETSDSGFDALMVSHLFPPVNEQLNKIMKGNPESSLRRLPAAHY